MTSSGTRASPVAKLAKSLSRGDTTASCAYSRESKEGPIAMNTFTLWFSNKWMERHGRRWNESHFILLTSYVCSQQLTNTLPEHQRLYTVANHRSDSCIVKIQNCRSDAVLCMSHCTVPLLALSTSWVSAGLDEQADHRITILWKVPDGQLDTSLRASAPHHMSH